MMGLLKTIQNNFGLFIHISTSSEPPPAPFFFLNIKFNALIKTNMAGGTQSYMFALFLRPYPSEVSLHDNHFLQINSLSVSIVHPFASHQRSRHHISQSSPAFSPLTHVKLEITLSVQRAPPSPNRLVGLTSFCSNLMVRVFLADKAKEDAGNVRKCVGRKHQDEFSKCAGT